MPAGQSDQAFVLCYLRLLWPAFGDSIGVSRKQGPLKFDIADVSAMTIAEDALRGGRKIIRDVTMIRERRLG